MKTLIIRSASMERLDACIAALGGAGDDTAILTHAHFVKSIKDNYPGAAVVEYPHAGNFAPAAMMRLARKGKLSPRYDKVIVLAGNISGAGHLNVLRAAVRFGPVEIYNVNNEFRPKNPVSVAGEFWGRILLSPAFFFATILTFAIGGVILLGCAIRNAQGEAWPERK